MSKKEVNGYTSRNLQTLLRETTSGEEVLEMLADEQEGQNRPAWISRITGRYKELRRLHEEKLGVMEEFK